MTIQMIPNSRMRQEAVALKADTRLKEGKLEKEGEAVKVNESGKMSEGGKGAGLAVTESTRAAGETVRVSQARQAADIGPIAETGKDGRRWQPLPEAPKAEAEEKTVKGTAQGRDRS